MYQLFEGIVIEGISSCVPKKKVDNSSFADILTGKELRMFEKTVGILERRWAEENVTASDLGYKAAQDLLSEESFDPKDISCIVFVSQTSDFKIPFTSNILQDRLGLDKDILCLDLNAGCAGFIQGLSTAFAMANSMENGKVLFIVAETLSKILSLKDRSTSMLFGDAASAMIVSKQKNNTNKAYFNFFSDGANYKAIQIPAGGYRNPVDAESLISFETENGDVRNNLNLQMDGPKVFDFTLREVANGVTNLLDHYAIDVNEIDSFLFHQSNRFIIKQIASQLNIDASKVLLNISNFGNTSGVSLPLLLTTERESMVNKRKVLFTGYGSGLTWGNLVLELDPKMIIKDLIEY